jgi:hypothetical protein
MYSPDLKIVLRAAGWTPERRVPIDVWKHELEEEGYSFSPEADAIISNFGNLVVNPAIKDDSPEARGVIEFDPALIASGNYRFVEDWERALGSRLSPLACVNRESMVLLSENGKCYKEWSGYLWFVADSFEAGLSELVFPTHALVEVKAKDGSPQPIADHPVWPYDEPWPHDES